MQSREVSWEIRLSLLNWGAFIRTSFNAKLQFKLYRELTREAKIV